MKNTLKHIISAMLCLAIAMTGISLDNAAIVNAATNVTEVKNDAEITMKPGDTKKFIVIGTDHKGQPDSEITNEYKWSSSDESIVKVYADFVSDYDLRDCLELIAAGTGTAAITGRSKYGCQPITLTVTVKLDEATAKQKKCRHSWKVTRKATCERAGLKTCKKCKLQESIAKKDHDYVNKKIKITSYEYVQTIRRCGSYDTCGWEYIGDKVPWYYGIQLTKDKTYGEAYAKVMQAYRNHIAEKHKGYDMGWYEWEEEGGTITTTVTDKVCKYCYRTKE